MHSIQHTRFFAQNYPQLQGLRAIPPGLCLLVVTLWANFQTGPARDLSFPILVAVGCGLAYLVIDQYYNRVYGRVRRLYSHAELFLSAAGALLALAAFIIDTRNLFDISLLGLVFAVTFAFTGLWYWRSATLLLAFSLVLSLVFAILSFSPLVGIQEWWSLLGLRYSLLAFSFLFGVFGVVSGVISHVYFIRSLPTLPEEK